LVNDGSPDSSLEIAKGLADTDNHVVVVDLSRNFGHHRAMMLGLSHALGEYLFLIDSDLEEEPEWLVPFQQQMSLEKSDVVYGVQVKRKGRLLERVSGRCFYSVMRLLTGMQLPENLVTARLMTRRYVKALLQHRERELFIAGLWFITGFSQRPQQITKHSSSVTTYTTTKKISQAINSVTSFSNLPLVAIFYFGVILSAVALAHAVYLIILRVFFAQLMSGWTSLMASLWLIGGWIILGIGVVGMYLAKIFSETKQRPYAIVREVYPRDRGDFSN